MLLSSLLMNLRTNLDEFSSPQLTTISTEGGVGPFDLTGDDDRPAHQRRATGY